MKFTITLLVGLFVANISINGQDDNLIFKRISVENGLSNASVISIFQDSKGFIWFGTMDGLNQYDGYEFTIYKKTPGDTLSLSDNRVEEIFEDSNNNLWIGTSNGLNLFDREHGKFTRFLHNPINNNTISHNYIASIIEDDGCLWITTMGGGINHYDVQKNKFVHYKHVPSNLNSISNNNVWTVFKDSNNNLWFGTVNEGINLFNRKTKAFTRYKFGNGNKLLNTISCISEISDNNYLVGTSAGLIKSTLNGKESDLTIWKNEPNQPNSISEGRVLEIFNDKSNNLWIAATMGLDIFDLEANNFTHFRNDNYNNKSISTNEVWSIVQDNQGQIWFGTYKGGINVLNPNQKHFKYWTHNPNNNKSLISKSVLAFEENQDSTLWLAIDHGGLSLFDRHKGTLKTFVHGSGENNGLLNNSITCLHLDSKNKLWLGYWAGGLSMFDLETEQFTHYCPPEFEIERWHIWDIHEDQNGLIWTASLGSGISCFNPSTNKFKTYMNNENDKKSLSHNIVWAIFQDSDDNLWIGTTNGLNKFNNKTNSFTYYPYLTTSNETPSTYNVFSIYEDTYQRLWIGTGGNGLNLFNKENGLFKAITEEDGMVNNTIYGILEDNMGNIWCSSGKGIAKITIDKKNNISQINNYYQSNGLYNDQFNNGAIYKSLTDELFFGGIDGFVFFNPNNIQPNRYQPIVHFRSLSILNEIAKIDPTGKSGTPLKKHISETNEITLTHKQSVFSLKFAALSYIAPEKNQYAYKLQGFDENWNYVRQKREATYTNLDAGTYDFKVKAANNDGIWSDSFTSLKITILPPWWKTWWFKSLIILFITVSLLSLYFSRVNQLKSRQIILEKKVGERTLELQNANSRLEEQKEEIINQAEGLKQLNDNLLTLNNELSEQKEKLQVTLTRLENTQSQLIQSEKKASLSIVTAGIAHEINNPLNFIQGGKTVIEDYLKANLTEHYSLLAPMLNIIKEGIKRTSAIVDSLNRANLKGFASKDSFNIHKIIDNCFTSLIPLIHNEISIEKDLHPTPIFIIGIEEELFQVFLNVLTNAIHALKSKGEIRIATSITNRKAKIEIIDTGCGISKENLKKVTDPFFTTKAPGKGIGLGMSMALSIIQDHNGSISYESEVGKGTCVTIYFPASE